MPLKEIQKQTDIFTSQFTPQYWQPLEILTRLTEETGELAREINHAYGTKKRKPEEQIKSIQGEIGDLLVTLFCIANSLDIDMDEVYREAMSKLDKRDRDRTK